MEMMMNIVRLAFPRNAQRSLLYKQFRSDVGKALAHLKKNGVPSCPLEFRRNPMVKVQDSTGLRFTFSQEEFQERTSFLKFYFNNWRLFTFPPKSWFRNLSYSLSQTEKGGLTSKSLLAGVQQTPDGTALFETAENLDNPTNNWGTEFLSRRPFQHLFQTAAANWRARFD
jgi:hypothetical protein